MKTFLDLLSRAIVADDGIERHGTLSAVLDALGFFILVAIVCGLTAIYATITGAW